MKQKTSRVLFDYWNALRQGRPAPRRLDIEPSRISRILAETMVLERVDFETYRFRLAGTEIAYIFGYELRGCNFVDLWPAMPDRTAVLSALSRVTRRLGGACIEFQAFDLDGKRARFEMMLLPLVHNSETVDRYLGTITEIPSNQSAAGRPLSALELISDEPIWPDAERRDMPKPALVGADPPLALDVRNARIVNMGRRRFRVYEGGRSGD
ncbi:MAG: PAS domain-containing protein [Pseudomonadota bacterium]